MYQELTRQILQQHDNRREWTVNDTPEHLETITLGEYQELIEAIDSFFVLENPDFEVASEVGDVGYLCLLYQEKYGEMPESMAGAWQAAQETCDTTGLQMTDCIGMKVIRNSLKHNDYAYNKGWQYNQATDFAKSFWKDMGGDKQFYKAYMEK